MYITIEETIVRRPRPYNTEAIGLFFSILITGFGLNSFDYLHHPRKWVLINLSPFYKNSAFRAEFFFSNIFCGSAIKLLNI